jgi:glucosamine--fructose-6-phosphate aminotransferase (isomerizing)
MAGAVCLSVSQSGQSPDIVDLTRAARAGGAYAIAVTNDAASPLAAAADATLDIHAGPELSVAATKTFVTSALACLWVLAEMVGDTELLSAIHGLPACLADAVQIDWSPVAGAVGAGSLYTLGRGPAWAISNEAALKFKEVCQLHAESYSSAEVLHGPVSIVERGFPGSGLRRRRCRRGGAGGGRRCAGREGRKRLRDDRPGARGPCACLSCAPGIP